MNKIMKILDFHNIESLAPSKDNQNSYLTIPPLFQQTANSENTHITILKTDITAHKFHMDNLFYVIMSGNSMQNLLNDGDKLIVDTSQKKLIDGKIYAFNQGNLFRIKILQNLPEQQIRIKSYNSYEYPDETVTLKDIELIGQIIYRGGFL